MPDPTVSREYPASYLHRYRIEGCANNDTHPCYTNPATEPGFQRLLGEFKDKILTQVEGGEGVSYYKYGDGDYYFLRGIPQGSAAPGRRALSKPYSEIGLEVFQTRSRLCDFYTCELYPENRARFRELWGYEPDYPAEFCYGLVANKWLLRTFAGKVGVLGGTEKVQTIKGLMAHQRYQDYLGLERFNDYVTIPERFACDDLTKTLDSVAEQLGASSPDTRIYLVGVGHVKSGLLSELPRLKKAVYLDVGTGLNMLAGCVSHSRPYAAAWTNFAETRAARDVDLMDFGEGRGVEEWL